VPPSPHDEDKDDDLVVDATGDDDDDDDGPLVEDNDAPVENSDADSESEDGEDDGPPVPSKTKNRPKTVVHVDRPVVVVSWHSPNINSYYIIPNST
jgi:hypothetical protein